jgi:formylglycine-generating enzyme required for sulfatase activity
MPGHEDTRAEIERLTVTIRDLLRQSTTGWVYWTQVARQHKGSVEFVGWLSGFAELPQWKHLFVTGRGVVKLTAEGLELANGSCLHALTETQRIASAVIHYAGRIHDTCLRVQKVAQVAKVGDKVVQALYVDLAEDPLPADTPVRLCPNGASPTHGKIVGQEVDGSVLYVAFDTEIFQEHLPAILRIDRGFLLNRLANQIDLLPSLPSRMKPLLDGHAEGFLIAHHNSLDVTRNLASLATPWTRMLWGPPGAGKTFAIGHLVTTLLKNDPQATILLAAPSNRAVDVALEAVVERLKAAGMERLIQDRKVLRFGYPRKPGVIEKAELLGPTALDALNKEVKRIARLIDVAEKEQTTDIDLALLRTQLLAAQEAVKTAVAEHVRQASLVATTTTLAFLPSSPVSSQEWNTVLVDEITMVTPAMCAFLASRAKQRFLLAGDPRQLGPVYERGDGETPNDYEWMGRDIFDKSGVSSGRGENRQIKPDDTRLARITSQRRCISGIWGRVEHLYPEIADATDQVALQHLADLIPSPGEPTVCLDTSSLNAKCEKFKGSWQNPLSAEVALDLAKTIVSDAPKPIRIAIITPYRAQVRFLRQLLRAERKAENTPYAGNEIEVGTVHQFQGSDADVVIFDVVDGQGRNDVGKLLTDDDGIRLVNVAITRAKGKLIVIADKEWCKRVHVQNENSLLGELVLGKRPTKTLLVQRRSQNDRPSPNGPSPERDKTESPIETALFDAMAVLPALSSVCSQYLIRDDSGIAISRADFAFENVRYAVYCDGRKWHLKEDRWEVDLLQRNRLAEIGWIFSVFSGNQILKDAHSCAAQISETYMRRLDPTAGSKAIGGFESKERHKEESVTPQQEPGEGPAEAEKLHRRTSHAPGQTVSNNLGITFAWIPSGSFTMGSPDNELSREVNETQHIVSVNRGFFLSIHPITQAQWKAVMSNNPSQFQGDALPVEKVSWDDCIAFCKKLSEKDGKQYRLPSEAEWEYACRSGSKTPFHCGSSITAAQGNFDSSYTYGGSTKATPRRMTTRVGSFSPNAWGFFDMHGNVWEWCLDWYGVYPKEDLDEYQGPKAGTLRVIRGGAWNQIPRRCRSAMRGNEDPSKRRKDIGFRICFTEL